MDIADPEIDFVQIAESMGVGARRVLEPSDLRSAVEWALRGEARQENRPVLLDIGIVRDPMEFQRVTRAALNR
jgi:thiamine pyrophosphate-dependent acetolactate synthase large subunit-like protein